MIYADNAATAIPDKEAIAAMMPYLTEAFGNASGLYFFGHEARCALENARQTVAACIGAEAEEIFFTSGGTESDNFALSGVMTAGEGLLLTSAAEHHAVLRTAASLKKQGKDVQILPVNRDGVLLPETLAAAITADTRLVSVMTVNNELGTVSKVCELAEIAHTKGAYFHTDAVQAVGHIPVNVKTMNVDLLSASAHKFGGPKGIGFLYVKKGTEILPYLYGGAQERGLRAGTENVAFAVAMAKALANRCENMAAETAHLLCLEEVLLSDLQKSGVIFHRNGGKDHATGILSLSFPHADGEAMLYRLDLAGICVSTGSACDSKNPEISHVLRAIDLHEDLAKGTLRISLSYQNTEAEMETIAREISKILT